MEGSCMELALEGERLCKAGDCRRGVQFFEAAVQVGTDDLKTLSAIYSQLGNAYFYLQEYAKALEFHKHDLNLARTLGDKLGEAKASGNLGNTFKVLGKFDEAIACCQRHLDVSRELDDKVGEARALYNLGNVYHAKGKHAGRSAHQDPGEFPPEVKDSLQKAAEYYEANLAIVKELGDRAAQGRACGNLGNTHYLLGNFKQAITYHEERLAIAKEFGDKSAERRAYSNLGNAHIFLGDFELAADHYKRTLQIAKQLGDKALEAQACYSLGNTYTLLRDYDRAIEYHTRHLMIAQDLSDRVGEGRACWSLGNAHTALGNHEKALYYATRHLDISKEIGDHTGQATAQMNLADLRTVLGIHASSKSIDENAENISLNTTDRSSIASTTTDSDETGLKIPRARRRSMENMELMSLTPDKLEQQEKAKGANGARPKVRVQKAATVSSDLSGSGLHKYPLQRQRPVSTSDMPILTAQATKKVNPDEDGFFELITKFQSRRMEDQRCSMRLLQHQNSVGNSVGLPKPAPKPEVGKATTKHKEEFLDMVAGLQSQRMNDQRANLPQFPGLHQSQAVRELLQKQGTIPDDSFFEMLMRCQGSRIEEQRSALPPENKKMAPTVPDEDFFSLIQRVQSSRLEEQRTELPLNAPKNLKAKPGSSRKKKK
ncbi:G-protein-signaling modulator 2-like [Lineus longissimus]|uniref:G-protein-signaling modulator 2-like n=1 Tax=Lineus longissimus TaxID=88925 RepID=UPI002B4C68DF